MDAKGIWGKVRKAVGADGAGPDSEAAATSVPRIGYSGAASSDPPQEPKRARWFGANQNSGVFSTALVPADLPSDLAVIGARDFSVPILVYVGSDEKEHGFCTNQHGDEGKVTPKEEAFVPLLDSRRNVERGQASFFTSEYLFANHYPFDNGLKGIFLTRARNLKDFRAVHPHGIGNIYWATLNFRVLFLNGEHIRHEVNTRLDYSLEHLDAEAKRLFNLGSPEGHIALPPPDQSNLTYGIVSADNGHQGNLEKVDLTPPKLAHAKIPVKSIEDIFKILMTNNYLYSQLGADNRTDFPFAYVCLFDKGGLEKRALPAAFIYQLRREAVLAGLNDGQKRRIYEGEAERLRKIQNRFPKLAHHNGANEAEPTVKTAFLWMTLEKDGLSLKGSVVAGNYEGCALDEMTPEELKELHKECSIDDNSKTLCEAYFRHIQLEGWVEPPEQEQASRASAQSDEMTVDEACKILGLAVPKDETAIPEKDITTAFRDAAKKWHPDKVHPIQEGDPTVDERRKAVEINLKKALAARTALNKKFGYEE